MKTALAFVEFTTPANILARRRQQIVVKDDPKFELEYDATLRLVRVSHPDMPRDRFVPLENVMQFEEAVEAREVAPKEAAQEVDHSQHPAHNNPEVAKAKAAAAKVKAKD